MRIFIFVGTILVIFILFTVHVLLVTKDAPDDSYLPSLESSISMLSPMTAMPQLFTPQEQTWIEEHPVLSVSMTPAFIPSSDPKQINAYTGLSLDYLRLLSRIIGLQFRIEPLSNWTMALEDAKQWRADVFAFRQIVIGAGQEADDLRRPFFFGQCLNGIYNALVFAVLAPCFDLIQKIHRSYSFVGFV